TARWPRLAPTVGSPDLRPMSVAGRFSGSAGRRLAKPATHPSTTLALTVQGRTFIPKENAHAYAPPVPSALVTRAGRGIGLAIARRLIGRGHEVAVADVVEANAVAAADQLGERAWALPLDVTDTAACREAASRVAERSGTLDVWVNNAGILNTGSSYEQPVE